MEIPLEAERVPGPMPIEEAEELKTAPKKRTRRRGTTPSLMDEDVQTPVQKTEEEQLKESVDKVMDTMRERYGIPAPTEEVVSKSQLDAWKKQFNEIYRTDLNGQTYIWHKLRRRDYIDIMNDETLNAIENTDLRIFMRQEKILLAGILHPSGENLERIVDENAGVAGNISDEIMLASGFRPVRSEKI
jgi:hypothetical protein